MLYTLVELNRAAMAPMRLAAKTARLAVQSPLSPMSDTDFGKTLVAMTNVFESATRYYGKPDWQIEQTKVNSVPVPITPVSAWRSPWCSLVHFKRDAEAMAFARGETAPPQPKLVIVAPLSGHYATLLRGTVEAFLPTHEVYITDWSDARMAPIWLGRFDLDDYIDTIRDIFAALGPGANALAVCQPGPPTLAAISMMAEDNDPNRPATMTFMGSPIDCRRSPTVPNLLAEERSFEWFEQNMIYTVPAPWPGMGRRVYPGFVQLSSFMNMNWERHVDAHWRFFNHLVEGDGDGIEKHRTFYDEYLAVLDLSEEFYLQTILKVFQEHHLARGMFRHRGRLVQPSAITDVALMTVEGEKDDISGIGQTQAAHDLCVNIPEDMRIDYIQPGVGHYGVFNGSRFKSEIVPRVNEFIARFGDESRQGSARRQAPKLRRVV
ncbi:MAG: polyhydroxyalkanoate depolymerase [Hyphomonadaceae bacterium]|nr:polyhydroxyalkanoate depolymerase [Hyphomonadaceae bacterium]